MTVLVTGASGSIGPSAIRAFRRSFPEVRAYVRRPDAAEALRDLGAKVAVGEADDVETLTTAMYGTFTVCHLIGAIDVPGEEDLRFANAGSVEVALEAAERAGVRRFLFLSSPGAETSSDHPFLRAKSEAESMIAASGLEHAIVRCAHVYGPGPGLWFSTALELALLDPPAVVGAPDERRRLLERRSQSPSGEVVPDATDDRTLEDGALSRTGYTARIRKYGMAPKYAKDGYVNDQKSPNCASVTQMIARARSLRTSTRKVGRQKHEQQQATNTIANI